MSNHNWPNLFLAGAPKSGTTTIVDWLVSTGEVFVPLGREPHFFAEDVFPERVCNTMNRYKALYSNAPDNLCYYLDGSTGYLCSNMAITVIPSNFPDAKFIVSVRDPAEMVISLHRERVNEGRERNLSAREAWRECSDAHHSVREVALDYQLQCDLASHVKKLQEQVPSSQLLLLSLKEVAERPKETYSLIMKFLDIKFTSYPSLQVHGEAIGRRSYTVQFLTFNAKRVRQKLGIPSIGLGVFKWFERLNTSQHKANFADEELLDDLRRELIYEKGELMELLRNRERYVLEDPL